MSHKIVTKSIYSGVLKPGIRHSVPKKVKQYSKDEIKALQDRLNGEGRLTYVKPEKSSYRLDYEVLDGIVYDLRTDIEVAREEFIKQWEKKYKRMFPSK